MKITKIFSLIIIVIFFCSCQTETDEYNTNDKSSSMKLDQEQEQEEIEVGCHPYHTESCIECGSYCEYEGEGCLPCVIVYPTSSIQYVNELIGQDPSVVADFFSDENNYKDIFPMLLEPENSSFLSLLQSGDYIISDIVISNDENRSVYIVENINDGTYIYLPYAIK